MRLPLPIALSVLVATILCATACTSTTPQVESQGASDSNASEQTSELVVVALQYALADEIAHVLSNSIDPHRVRIQPYARTNSLILVGAPSELGPVKLLISKLDIPAK